jgi:hypothetical protein
LPSPPTAASPGAPIPAPMTPRTAARSPTRPTPTPSCGRRVPLVCFARRTRALSRP